MVQLVDDGSSIPPSSTALVTEGEQTSLEGANDDVSEISGSVVGSVMGSGSGFSRTSNSIFLLTPISPGIQKITNMDEAMYDKGYGTDGDIGPFYDLVEHEEDPAPNIGEEIIPSKEELEALMA
eukprot:5186454-Ditylum_brightwellii.AAC.1